MVTSAKQYLSQTITSPTLFTGLEIGSSFVLFEPLLERAVSGVANTLGQVANTIERAPRFLKQLSKLPSKPISWFSRNQVAKIFGASFLYSSVLFGLKGLPDFMYSFLKRNILDPLETRGGFDHNSLAYHLLDGGLVLGLGTYLNRHQGNNILFRSETFGNMSAADLLIFASDYASNIAIFGPLMATALGAPIGGFMLSGALLYWAALLGASHLTSVWASQGREMDIALGRAGIFVLTNTALAFKSNQIFSARATNGIQVGIGLSLTALCYYFTSNERTH